MTRESYLGIDAAGRRFLPAIIGAIQTDGELGAVRGL
jgi:hypothetical protein